MLSSVEGAHLPPGSFYLLNDNEFPFSSRLKLCRALWVSTNYVFPHKHQSLLNWLCIQIGKLKNQTDLTLAWRVIASFLKSKSLAERIRQQPSDILIKHNLIQAVTISIAKNFEELEAFKDIVSISKCLIENNRITSPLRLRFEVLATFLAEWISVVIRYKQNHTIAEDLFAGKDIQIECVIQLIALLLNYCENMIKKQTNKKRIHSLVCQHLLVPTFQLHYICCQLLTCPDKNKLWREVADRLESFLTLSMFSKNCLDVYAELLKEPKAASATDTDKENIKEKKINFSKFFELFSASLNGLFKQSAIEEIKTAHYARYFLHSFLSCYAKCDSKLKFAMLKELFKCQCKHEPKCSAQDVTRCTELNLIAVHGVFELAKEFHVYQPAVDREHGSVVLNWFKEIASTLLKKYNLEIESMWYSCIQALLHIDNTVIESHIIDLIGKVCLCEKFPEENRKLIVCLIEVYAKIRQPVKLVKTLLQTIKRLTEKEQQAEDIANIASFLESFGELMGSALLSNLSPSLIMEIWSLVVEKINEVVISIEPSVKVLEGDGALESFKSSANDYFHLLVCFLHCIVSCSPVLIMWNHLGVRGKLDACIGSLKKTACFATRILDLQPKKALYLHICSRLVESSLKICLTYQRVTSFIERYCLKDSSNISPGVVSLLHKRQQMQYKELFGHDEPHILACLSVKPTTNSAKLLLLRLMRIKLSDLNEKIHVVEMLQKTGELECLDLENKMCKLKIKYESEVNRLTEVLTDVLETIDIIEFIGKGCDKLGLLIQTLKILTETLPLLESKEIQQNPTFTNWIAEAIFAVISDENYPNFIQMQESISHLLQQVSAQHDNLTVSKLLHKINKEMSDSISDAVPLLPKLLTGYDVSGALSALFKDNKCCLDVQSLNPKALTQLKNVFNVFSYAMESLHLEGLSIQQTEAAVCVNLCCIKTADILLSSYELGDETEKEKYSSLLQRFVSSLIQLTKGKNNGDIMKYLAAEIMFHYFARLLENLSNDTKKNGMVFLRNMIQFHYRNSSSDVFVEMLYKHYSPKQLQKSTKTRVRTLTTMIHLHMEALLDIFCYSNDSQKYSHTEDKGTKRKLKIKSNVEICKKLRLEDTDNSGNGAAVSLLLVHLQKLMEASYCILEKFPAKTTSLKYRLLHSCIIAKDVLSYHNIELKELEDAHDCFREAIDQLKNERNNECLSEVMHFTSSYLQYCTKQVFDKELLHKLISLLSSFDQNSTERGFLHETIIHLLKRLPVNDLPIEIFEDILGGLRKGTNNIEMLNLLEFIHLLLHSDILLGTGNDYQQMKSNRNRFVKCVLDELLKQMNKYSRETNFNAAEIMQKIILGVHSILQVKWIRLQLTHISSILSSIFETPLVSLVDTVESKADADSFLSVYEACYKVVHSVVVSYKEIQTIVPLVIAAYRQLIKSALYLSRQREYTSNRFYMRAWDSQTKDELIAAKGIQCARMMEKLSQFIADNYKKAFSKCVSYVVADYVHCVCSFTIVPSVKMSFTIPIYHLISIMDEYGIAMLRNALPAGFRDVFQTLHLDYCRNFKYMGQV